MKLKDIIETVIREIPSSVSGITYDLGKEIHDMQKAILKYEESAIKQFLQIHSNKLVGKTVEFAGKTFSIKELKFSYPDPEAGKDDYELLAITDQGQTEHIGGKIQILNNQEAPVTNLTRNVPKQTSANQIKHF